MKKLIAIFLILFSKIVSANTIEVFGKTINIPKKYVLEVPSSLVGPTIHYRTSNLTRAMEFPVEFVTIGTVADYIDRHGIDRIDKLGKVINQTENYKELEVKAPTAVNGLEYIYRIYFSDEFYISYMVLNIEDIDCELRQEKIKGVRAVLNNLE